MVLSLFLFLFFAFFFCIHLLNLLPCVTSLLEMQWFFSWLVRRGSEENTGRGWNEFIRIAKGPPTG